MTDFYDRRWELLINDDVFIEATDGQQFKVVFNVIIDFGGYVSYADIAIYNLAQDTIAKAFKRGSSVGLRAGYVDTIDFIFKGRITNILKERIGPDVITRIIARGGSQPNDKTINSTLGKNATVVDAIRQCVASMGYPLVIEPSDFATAQPFARGYTLTGDPRVHMDKLAETFSFSYVLENDRIIVVADGKFRKGSPLVIDQFNGMEGIPEITENGADVTLRLSPKVRIGGRIDIQSNLVTFNFSNLYYQNIPESAGKGIYRVYRLNHSGDSWGDAWSTRITGFR